MSQIPTFNFKLLTLHFRRELRIALLAAMETCWVFAVVVFLAEIVDAPRPLTPLPFFLTYWLAMILGRVLPRSETGGLILQVIAFAIAIITLLAVARAELYPTLDWYDWAWLPRFIPALLSMTRGVVIEHIVAAGTLYVFIRGLGLAQRPLTLWFVGLQFRIGIVIFFVLLLIAGLARAFSATSIQRYDASLWIFIYFFISLLAIALARIEEMTSDVRYTPRWAITLLGSIALVLFTGLGVLQFLTVDLVRALMIIFVPIAWVFGGIIVLLSVPFGYLLEWLVKFLQPLFAGLEQLIDSLQRFLNQDTLTQQSTDPAITFSLTALIQPAFVLAIGLLVLYLLGRALNRRMHRLEEETFVRESLGADDASELARRDDPRKKKPARPRSRNAAAESIRKIYAALVARAADAGLPRRVAETPYEFEPRLAKQWLEHSDDIRTITEAYVEVHYAEHDATRERLDIVKDAWERIQKNAKRQT